MNTNNVTNWLEKLQQESWNLELLISGFSILLLIQAKEQLTKLIEYFNLHYAFSEEIASLIYTSIGMGILSCVALAICLVVHILVRGFWIGTIGLRSVQPKVDFKRLRYAPAFQQKLEQKLPSLDRSLIRLDQVSSAIFSFAFLIIFMLLSLVAWFVVLTSLILLRDYIYDLFETETLLCEAIYYTFTVVIFAILIFSLLYLIDTLSGGSLKKIKWLKSRPYIWIYQLMVVITFSFLYRSIYYHLLSYFGIWASRVLLSSFILSMIFMPFLRLDHEIYFPDEKPDNKVWSYYYNDLRIAEETITSAAIPSLTISSNQLPLFIRYSAAQNKTIQYLCTNYQPSRKMGLSSGIRIDENGFGLNEPSVEEASADSLLACLSSIYSIKIDDSLYQDLRFYYMEHPNRGELGIQTVVNIKSLTSGHHLLKVEYKDWSEYRDTVRIKNWANIPFWKE
ncbi:MAG: hypothetical protein AAF849_24895 [Bacteroidota bacterium]